MTRDFSKQERDDLRPNSRNTPHRSNNNDQPSQPTRPRLSRDAVDRAWENGAARQHADYHPRQNPSSSSYQQQGRPNPQSERFQSTQNRPNYGPRQEPQQGGRFSQDRGGYQPRPRNFDSSRSTYQRGPSATYRGYRQRTEGSEGQERQPGSERDYQPRPRNFDSPARPNYQRGPTAGYRDYQDHSPNPPRFREPERREPAFRDDRRPRETPNEPFSPQNNPGRFREGTAYPPRQNTYRSGPNNRPGRPGRDGRDFSRGNRRDAPEGPAPRDAYNPRWQSRPAAQQNYQPPQQNFSNDRSGAAHFEGDYERFNTSPRAERPEAPAFEKHVTPLSDGRVLKGSRPYQRKQERFWNEIADETKEVLPVQTPTEAPTHTQAPAQPVRPARKAAPEGEKRKQPGGKSKAVKTVRTSRVTASKDEQPSRSKSGKRPSAPGKVIHPSHRGYKWPTPGEEKNI